MKKLSLILLMGGLVFAFGCNKKKNNNMGYDNLKDKNHVFTEVEFNEVRDLFLEKEDFYLFLAFPSCPWCKEYITYVNDIAKDNDIEKVYYMNIRDFRKYTADFSNMTITLDKDYQELIDFIGDSFLSERIIYNEENESEFITVNNWIYAPTLLAINNGEVVKSYETVPGHDRDQGVLPPLTDEQKAFLIETYNELFNAIK